MRELSSFAEISEYRVTLKTANSLTEMEIEVEPREAASSQLPAAIQRAIQTAFNLRVPVKMVAPNSLPRSEMKSRRWVRA